MTGPVGLSYLGCHQPPAMLTGDHQAWCGNEDCKVVIWDPTLTVDENLEHLNVIDLRGLRGG